MDNIEYTATYYNLHIVDSYKVRKKDFRSILLKAIEEYYTNSGIYPKWYTERSLSSLYWEWLVHNFLYRIHYKRERTASVDLNYPCDYSELVYKLIGVLVWVFVK